MGNANNLGDMLDDFEWSSYEARMLMFSLFLFHKIIHCRVVYIEKANNLNLLIVRKLPVHHIVLILSVPDL